MTRSRHGGPPRRTAIQPGTGVAVYHTHLLLREWKRRQLDQNGEQNDGKAVRVRDVHRLKAFVDRLRAVAARCSHGRVRSSSTLIRALVSCSRCRPNPRPLPSHFFCQARARQMSLARQNGKTSRGARRATLRGAPSGRPRSFWPGSRKGQSPSLALRPEQRPGRRPPRLPARHPRARPAGERYCARLAASSDSARHGKARVRARSRPGGRQRRPWKDRWGHQRDAGQQLAGRRSPSGLEGR